MTGGTLQMAEAAALGARTEPALRISLLRAAEANAADVLEASAYVFASPENLAAMSGQMKDFFDRVYYAATATTGSSAGSLRLLVRRGCRIPDRGAGVVAS